MPRLTEPGREAGDGVHRRLRARLQQQARTVDRDLARIRVPALCLRATRMAASARARSTAGATVSSASRRSRSSAGVAQRPSSANDSAPVGSVRTGAIRASDASGASTGTGAFANVVESTSPRRFGGGSAAMAIATGPEKDSPSSTKASSRGSASRASVSRSR